MKNGATTNPYALYEAPRALYEMGTLAFSVPVLSQIPQGDGHGVWVIPGFGASDRSTFLLRQFLQSKGYIADGWGLGKNLGLLRSGGMEALLGAFLKFQHELQQKISIIGWSLGGVHARRIAKEYPELIRQIICLGSPIHAFPSENEVWTVYESVDGVVMNNEELLQIKDFSMPPSTPCTSIFSKSDGVVPWHMAMELEADLTDNIEVFGSHIGLGVNPSVFYIIADRLSQQEGAWQKFRTSQWQHRLALGILDPIGQLMQSRLFSTAKQSL